jgi:hypothetical protein
MKNLLVTGVRIQRNMRIDGIDWMYEWVFKEISKVLYYF